jgi:protein involved in sex pheromone biosynthesis
MKKTFFVILLAWALLSACSEQEQQQAADDISFKKEREKTEQVQKLLNDKVAADRKKIDEAEQ